MGVRKISICGIWRGKSKENILPFKLKLMTKKLINLYLTIVSSPKNGEKYFNFVDFLLNMSSIFCQNSFIFSISRFPLNLFGSKMPKKNRRQHRKKPKSFGFEGWSVPIALQVGCKCRWHKTAVKNVGGILFVYFFSLFILANWLVYALSKYDF